MDFLEKYMENFEVSIGFVYIDLHIEDIRGTLYKIVNVVEKCVDNNSCGKIDNRLYYYYYILLIDTFIEISKINSN